MIPSAADSASSSSATAARARPPIAIDTILNQKGTGVICIYVESARSNRTTPACTKCSEDAAPWHIPSLFRLGRRPPLPCNTSRRTPTRSEEIRDNGGHALSYTTIFQTRHSHTASLSLPAPQAAGTRGLPGDIFNLHSRLLERSAKLSDKLRRDRSPPCHHRDAGGDCVGVYPDKVIP